MTEMNNTYKCSKCGRTEEKPADKPEPVCCDEIMVKNPLDQCTIADHSEMVRNTDVSDACDDGRGKS